MRKLVKRAGRDRLLDAEVRLVDRLRGRSVFFSTITLSGTASILTWDPLRPRPSGLPGGATICRNELPGRLAQCFVTVSVAVVVCTRLPLTPVMLSVKVPLTPVAVCTRSVELVVAGLDVNVAVAPKGWPLTPRLTDPLKPLRGAMVTV